MLEQLAWAGAIAIFVWLSVRPTLPSRRIRHGGEPLPHLARGPLVPVAPAVFYGGHTSRFLSVASAMLGFATLALGLAGARAAGDEAAIYTGLAIASAIVAITFTFSNWFATRMHLRVDQQGLHSRLLFGEHTIRWCDVTGLSLRYVRLPRTGLPLVYYGVTAPRREFAFPHTQAGAAQLRRTIEAATGLRWDEPDGA